MCRAIRKDAVPIAFGLSRMSFDIEDEFQYDKALEFLSALPNDIVSSLRRISVYACTNIVLRRRHRYRPFVTASIDLDSNRFTAPDVSAMPRDDDDPVPDRLLDFDAVKRVAQKVYDACKKRDLHKEDLLALLKILHPPSDEAAEEQDNRIVGSEQLQAEEVFYSDHWAQIDSPWRRNGSYCSDDLESDQELSGISYPCSDASECGG